MTNQRIVSLFFVPCLIVYKQEKEAWNDMDQKKIGAFIAQCRKEKNMSQMQLAELLGITNQAISKWETGRGMPDISLLQPLCDVLGISLNELFSGEYISVEDYREKAEENISNLFREKQFANLKPVKYLFSGCANATLLIIGVESLIGLIGQFFSPAILKPMLVNVAVWAVLFLASAGKLIYDKRRLKALKQSGAYISAEISEILPVNWIQFANYHTCRVVCNFAYEGEHYRAVSNYYIISPFKRREDLYAKVYFNKDNPLKNSIELLQV